MGFKPKCVHRAVGVVSDGVLVLCSPYSMAIGPERYAACGPITCKSCIGVETGIKLKHGQSTAHNVNSERIRDQQADRESDPCAQGPDPKIA
jgi:hypothetical protein